MTHPRHNDAPVFENRKARFEFEIVETFEAGIMLMGSEVKSLRAGQASLSEAFASDRNGELYLIGCSISPYAPAGVFGHTTPRRPRKLLLRRREINRIIGALTRDRLTLVPLQLSFSDKGLAKVTLALAKGKNKADKRETIKERDWNRQKARTLRGD